MSEELKILFYTFTPRAFRTTLIYHLYEIAQKHRVVLLSEKLDAETEKLIADKNLFPKIERVISVSQFTGESMGAFKKAAELGRVAREAVAEHKPDVVFVANDVCLFELFLLREARKISATGISTQSTLIWKAELSRIYIELTNAYTKYPKFLPLLLRVLTERIRKLFAHFAYYWILPITAGMLPFPGKSSFVLWRGSDGMRLADYQVAFSERNRDFHVYNGVPKNKLFTLAHPLSRATTRNFFSAHLSKANSDKDFRKTAAVMYPVEIIYFSKNGLRPIFREELEQERFLAIQLMSEILVGWQIVIKPHPNMPDIDRLQTKLTEISPAIKLVDPSYNADEVIKISDVVVGFPTASTTIFTALMLSPTKPAISLDFHADFMGDYYKDFPGVDYITDKESFAELLKRITNHTYTKSRVVSEKCNFENASRMVEFLRDKQKQSKIQ